MTWKEKYDILIEEIAEQPSNTFSVFEIPEIPEFMDISFTVKGDMTFNFRLNEKLAKEKDYKEFCEYLCEYVGYELGYFFADDRKSFKNFKKK